MLQINNLTYGYSDNDLIINNLSLNFKAGSINCILGSNGSGKSTLCKLIANICVPDNGNILLNDQKLNAHDVSLVFQNPIDQFVRPIVYDDIAFGLENKNINITEIKEMITSYAKEFEIEHLLQKNINSLSGGEKQKVAIVSNLILKPKILIMDEATEMLDPITRISLLKKIKSFVKKQNIILIYITHDMELAFSTEKIIVLNNGRVLKTGGPLEIFNDNDIVEKNRLTVPYSLELMNEVGGQYCYTDIVSFKDNYELTS